MKKYLLSLVVLVFMLFSLSSVSYAEVVESTDGSAYIVTGQNSTLSDQTIAKDLYIPKGCTLITTGNIAITGNVYVFGTLQNTGVLNINQTLYCLHYGSMFSAGNYNYGYVTPTGRITAKNMVVNASFLNTTIPSIASTPTSEPNPEPGSQESEPEIESETTADPDVHVHRWQREHSYKIYCSDTGSVHYRCSECGKTEYRTVGPEEHKLTEEIGLQPTCIASGFKSLYCSECLYYDMVVLPATGKHTYGKWFTVQPTCSTNGSHFHRCTVCGIQQSTKLSATGKHKYGNWKTITVATRYISGKKVHSCSICGRKDYQTIAKLKTKASKDEINVKKAADSFFSALKKYDIKKLQKCFATPKKVTLFAKKKNVAQYIRTHNKSLKYQIQDIKVSKKTATVTVSCNYFNAYSQFYDSFDDCVSYLIKKKHVSDSALDKYQYNRLLHYDKTEHNYVTAKITLKFKKVGKNWKLQNPSTALYNAMHCNYTKAYNDYF